MTSSIPESENLKIITKVVKVLTRCNSVIRTGLRSGRISVNLKEAGENRFEVVLICESSLLANLVSNSCNLTDVLPQLNDVCEAEIVGLSVQESARTKDTGNSSSESERRLYGSWGNSGSGANCGQFIKLEENEFAFEVVKNMIKSLSTQGVLLYGPSGNGKSHLCQYLVDRAKSEGVKTFLIHSTAFVSWFVHSVYKNNLDSLRRDVLSAEIFILEDAQELIGKEKTQKEVSYLIQTLVESGKRVVLTADRNLMLESGLSQTLRSKLAGFLPCEIGSPKRESRVKFLKAKLNGFLNDKVLQFVAEQFQGSLRQLETFVKNVQIYQSLSPKNGLGIEEIKKILKRFIEFDSTPGFDLTRLVNALASIYKVEPKVLLSNSKRREAVRARAILVVVLRDHFRLNFSQISKLIGMRDHSASLKIYTRVKQDAPNEVQEGVNRCIEIYRTAC